MLNVAFSQSKYYVDNLSENIKRGIRQKLRNGIWPSKPPVGYLNDRNTRSIVVDPARAPLVRKAFELYATGNYALHEVRARMKEVGLVAYTGKDFSTSNWQALFKNPFYYGEMLPQGETFEGKQPQIDGAVSPGIHEVVAFILGVMHPESPLDILRQGIHLE